MATHSGTQVRSGLGLVVLCLAAAVNLLQSASLSPLLPRIGQEFGTADATTGQLATLGSIVGFAFSLVAAPWMDRWSRRTWFRVEGALIAAGVLIAALAPSFLVLACGRILAASGAALIMANCMTGARELFPDVTHRNRAVGIIVSASTLVFIIGLPIVTQIEVRFGWRMAMAAIAIPALALVAGAPVLPAAPGANFSPRRAAPLAAFRAVLSDRRVSALLAVLGLVSALYTGWFVYFGAYATAVFAVSAGLLGLLFLLCGIAQLLANNLAPVLLNRVEPRLLVIATLASVATALLLTGIVVTTLPVALLAAIVVLNGAGMAYIATNVLILDSDMRHPGGVMALAGATGSLGAALGPFLTGVALAQTGSFEAAYRTLGLLAPLAIVTLWYGYRHQVMARVAERPS